MLSIKANFHFTLPEILTFHPSQFMVNVTTSWGKYLFQDILRQKCGDSIVSLSRGTCVGYLEVENTQACDGNMAILKQTFTQFCYG